MEILTQDVVETLFGFRTKSGGSGIAQDFCKKKKEEAVDVMAPSSLLSAWYALRGVSDVGDVLDPCIRLIERREEKKEDRLLLRWMFFFRRRSGRRSCTGFSGWLVFLLVRPLLRLAEQDDQDATAAAAFAADDAFTFVVVDGRTEVDLVGGVQSGALAPDGLATWSLAQQPLTRSSFHGKANRLARFGCRWQIPNSNRTNTTRRCRDCLIASLNSTN